jgi:hypothetical protein
MANEGRIEAKKQAERLYPLANQEDYPDVPNVNRMNVTRIGAFMAGYDFAVKQSEQTKEVIEKAFVAGRSKTSWEQFCLDNNLLPEVESNLKNLLSVVHNMIGVLENKDWERLPSKLWDLKFAYEFFKRP